MTRSMYLREIEITNIRALQKVKWTLPVEGKRSGEPQTQLDRRRDALLRLRHQTVWFEMKRQQAKIPELAELFARAPESLGW